MSLEAVTRKFKKPYTEPTGQSKPKPQSQPTTNDKAAGLLNDKAAGLLDDASIHDDNVPQTDKD